MSNLGPIPGTKKYKKEEEERKRKKHEADIKAKRDKINKERKEGKDVLCAAVSRKGNRCKNKVLHGESYCTIHVEVEQNESGKKKRCKKIKSDGKRCKMNTSAKSGYCYYHD